MQALQITLFGRLAIRRGERSIELPAKAAELLCYLLLHRGQPQTREVLATELWGEAGPAQGKKYLRQILWQLQQAFEGGVPARPLILLLDHDWIAIHADANLRVDAYQIEDACAPLTDPVASPFDVTRAREAAELYRGDLLEGWYQEWCLAERERYQMLYISLLEQLAGHCAMAGMFDAGIAYGLRLLRLEPARERSHRQLMRIYALAGDHGAALGQFARCADILEREFGVAPSALTLALDAQIRAGMFDGDALVLAGSLADELAQLRACITSLQGEVERLKGTLGLRA